jgi:hypothetical protein
MNEPSQDTKPVKQFSPDLRIGYLAAIGLLGLICGFIIMARNDVFLRPCDWNESTSNFHEIAYKPREIAAQAFQWLSDSLFGQIKAKKRLLQGLQKPGVSPSDSIKMLTQDIAADSLNKAVVDRHEESTRQAGTADSMSFVSLNRMLHFRITPETVRSWAQGFDSVGYDWSDTATYWLKIDDTKPALSYSGVTRFRIDHPVSDIQFGTKYPMVGTWVLLIVIFCAFCFIATSTALNEKRQLLKYFKNLKISGPSERDFFLVWAAVLAGMGILAMVQYFTFSDELPMKPIYFMRSFRWSMLRVNLIGYISGSSCLAGFIYCASLLGFSVRTIRQHNRDIYYKKAITPVKEDPAQASTAEQQELEEMQKKRLEDVEIFKRLDAAFSRYFVLSAIILSLLVLCTGALASTFNSLEFVRLLSDDWGYSPGRPEFAYLFGGIYTVVLLLVYLPARIRFNEIRIDIALPDDPNSKAGAAAGDNTSMGILKNTLTGLKDVLIVSSPFLTSILQGLLDAVFK